MDITTDNLLPLNDFATRNEFTKEDWFMLWAKTDEDPSKISGASILSTIQNNVVGGQNAYLDVDWVGSSQPTSSVYLNDLWLDTKNNVVWKYGSNGKWTSYADVNSTTYYLYNGTRNGDYNIYSIIHANTGNYVYASKVKLDSVSANAEGVGLLTPIIKMSAINKTDLSHRCWVTHTPITSSFINTYNACFTILLKGKKGYKDMALSAQHKVEQYPLLPDKACYEIFDLNDVFKKSFLKERTKVFGQSVTTTTDEEGATVYDIQDTIVWKQRELLGNKLSANDMINLDFAIAFRMDNPNSQYIKAASTSPFVKGGESAYYYGSPIRMRCVYNSSSNHIGFKMI